ncbi:MAG: variant leucine-rich repeat-containing protein [Nostoc sp.]
MQPLQPVSGSDLQRFLSAPEELLQESVGLQLAVASFHQTPRSLLEILLKSPDEQVAEAASLHVNFAGEITDGWQQAVDEILQQRQLGQNDRLAVELLKIGPVPPCFLSEWVPSERLIQGLRNPQMPLRYRLQFLQRLSQEPSLEPRLQVAESPETPSAVLEQLAGDLELPVRLAVKFNPSSPPPLIELVEGQYAVASDWNTDSEQLAILGQSRWAWVRLAVAQNPSATAETLMQLAGDAVYKIQLAVAKNPETPPDVLAVLEEHQDKTIQAAVAEHPNATEEILHQLFPTQQQLLKKRKNLPATILERFFNELTTNQPIWKNKELRYFLLKQPNTPTRFLAELANIDLEALRAEKLEQAGSTPGISEKWVQDEIGFLTDVAEHPQVSVEILERLAQYPNSHVKLAVAQNSQTPEQLKLRILSELILYAEDNIKVEIAKNPETPVYVLEAIGQNESYRTKLLREIRRVLAFEYAVNANSFNSTADRFMSNLKHQTLYPNNIVVNINQLMRLFESPDFLEIMTRNLSYEDTKNELSLLMNRFLSEWTEMLFGLSNKLQEQVVTYLVRILALINSEVKMKLTANPNTPVTILTRLGLEENLVNQRNPNTPGIVLAQAVKSMSSKNLADFIKHPVKGSQMPAETLSQLASHTDSSVRYRVASHPNTPATVLRQLARDSYVATVRAVASNANTFPETLEVLASHPDFTTRLEVVRNPNTPPRALAQIVLSTQNSGNTPNQTVDMLKSAFPGDHNDVLRSIAGNPRTPREVLEILARREFIGATPDPRSIIPPTTDDSIVRSLAYNPSLTPQLLGILVQDPCVEVRVCLVRHPNLTEALWLQLAEDTEISVREVAATINAPVSVLELLAQDEQVEVRIKVATNPNTPISVLQLLAGDENSSVRTAAASNSNLPETILTQLANDEKVEVRRAVAQNPNTPAPIRETLRDLIVQPTTRQTSSTLRGLNRLYNPSTDDLVSILAEYASSENAFVRFVTLLHPLTPHKVLTQAAQSASWLERYAVADNSGTPSVLRQQLAQDSNRIVRAAARV